MRRRITAAIVAVTGLILVALGLPLAIVVRQSILDKEVVELHAAAVRTLAEIRVPIDPVQLASVRSEPDAPPSFSVYDSVGNRVFGVGPPSDSDLRHSLQGATLSSTAGQIVVTTPITDDTNEHVIGVLRLAEPLTEVNSRARRTWLVMALAGIIALALAWLLASRVARRLSQPVAELAEVATTIGRGGMVHPPAQSGIRELDLLARALAESSDRVVDALARERGFTSDVSHQLRTPLTGLRLRVEAADPRTDPDFVEGLLDDLDRLDETVEHLLALARGSQPAQQTISLDGVAEQAVERWQQRVHQVGRSIELGASPHATASGSAASVSQILDILVDNALQHGTGAVRVVPRRLAGGGAIDVVDEGSVLGGSEGERIFQRGHGRHNGIGLALARSIAEANGGRLLLARQRPTTFTLILVATQA